MYPVLNHQWEEIGEFCIRDRKRIFIFFVNLDPLLLKADAVTSVDKSDIVRLLRHNSESEEDKGAVLVLVINFLQNFGILIKVETVEVGLSASNNTNTKEKDIVRHGKVHPVVAVQI